MSDPVADGRFGGIDGDTEINGTAFDDQFFDIVWMPLSRDHGEFPLFALFVELPAEGVVCDDIDVPCDPELEVVADAELEVA